MTLKQKIYKTVFDTDTKAGKVFDVFLLWIILASVFIVMTESIHAIGEQYARFFFIIEWIFTIIFTLEYILRIWASPKPFQYIFSFWGILDLIAFLPTYLSFMFYGYHYLLIVRIFRLLRVFRILKLVRFHKEAQGLLSALKSSLFKISIFLGAVIAFVVFLGTLMYVVEGGERGFTSIPQSIYWAIVTVTTVGYGDLVPQTVLGKLISSVAMILGYAIIAVPTGIVTVAMANSGLRKSDCDHCGKPNDDDSIFCKICGVQFHPSVKKNK